MLPTYEVSVFSMRGNTGRSLCADLVTVIARLGVSRVRLSECNYNCPQCR